MAELNENHRGIILMSLAMLGIPIVVARIAGALSLLPLNADVPVANSADTILDRQQLGELLHELRVRNTYLQNDLIGKNYPMALYKDCIKKISVRH